jgi:hypothetical protein
VLSVPQAQSPAAVQRNQRADEKDRRNRGSKKHEDHRTTISVPWALRSVPELVSPAERIGVLGGTSDSRQTA